jgi:hypothetical protein
MAKLLNMEGVAYVLLQDRELPLEDQTIFHIRPLKVKERSAVQDGTLVTEIDWAGPKNQGGKGIMRHLSGTQQMLALTCGLEKIENLKTESGEVLVYNKDLPSGLKEKVLDRLNPEWLKEISEKILVLSGLSKEEEKN